MGAADEFRPFGNVDWFGYFIPKLPIEIVMRNAQDGLLAAVRKLQIVSHVFAPDVHVRLHPDNFAIFLKGSFGRGALPIGVIGRDGKGIGIGRR